MKDYRKMISLCLDIVDTDNEIIVELLDVISRANVYISNNTRNSIKEKTNLAREKVAELRKMDEGKL